jgi:hypothetical protein
MILYKYPPSLFNNNDSIIYCTFNLVINRYIEKAMPLAAGNRHVKAASRS